MLASKDGARRGDVKVNEEELDTKQKVLLAMYVEYQKDLPEMDKNIRPDILGITRDVFYVALEKLVNEGWINVRLSYADGRSFPFMAYLDKAKLTRDGINYVENKLKIDKTLNGKDKVRQIVEKAGSWGFSQLKDIAVKALAEMIARNAAGI